MKVKTIIPKVERLWREQKERYGLDIELSNVSLQAQNALRLHKMHRGFFQATASVLVRWRRLIKIQG